MKIAQLVLIILLYSTLPVFSASDHDSHDHEENGQEEFTAEDYLGFSMEVPTKTQKLIGLETEGVKRTSTEEKIPVTGRIAQDVENVQEVFPPQSGKLKECLTSIGSIVSKEDILCTLETENSNIIEIKSPSSGVVITEYVKTGEHVDTVLPIQAIADLSRLSANFDIYENDMGKVHKGQSVAIYSSAYPEITFEGKIVFVSPRVDETTFTVKIRVEIDNAKLLLKPGMFVRGEIAVQGKEAHLMVPSDAIQNLDGMDVVFVQDDEEYFTPTQVQVAYASHKQSFVEGELKEGDLVVSEGAFILKSKIMESEIVGGCAHGH